MEEHGTWLHWLYTLHILPKSVPEAVPVTFFIVILLSLTVIIAKPKLTKRNPGRFQAFLEFVVSSLDGFVRNVVGDEAKTLTPIIGTLFLFILIINMFGIIPGFISPSANINTTAGLAIFAFLLVQFYGVKKQGIKYFKHFLGEPLWLCPLMLPIHIIGEFAKPLSLAIRLFGNIFGEEMVIAVLILIATSVLPKIHVPFAAHAITLPIPFQFPMLLFAVFTSFVQALVFSMLLGIYISVAVASHDEH